MTARTELKALAEPGRRAPSYNDFVVKACALALREHPRTNGSYRDGRFELHERVNGGVAVAADDALLVPVVADADRKGLAAIAAETRAGRQGAQRVDRRSRALRRDLHGLQPRNARRRRVHGDREPASGRVLAVGAIRERAVVRAGQVVARRTAIVTLSCDHRILYGADAAAFLARVRTLLEHPIAMAL